MDSDSTTELFLAALTGRDFAGAALWLDDSVGEALSPARLAVMWDAHVASFGRLCKWAVVERAKVAVRPDVWSQMHARSRASFDGPLEAPLDLRIVILTFERGELQTTLSIRSQVQRIAGLFFEPLPRSPRAFVHAPPPRG